MSLDQSTISRSGIKVEALATTKRRTQTRAYGTAVDLQPLIDLRVSLTKARAAASESQRDFVRQQSLYAAGQGVSKEAVQEAEVVARADEAAVQSFTSQAHQQWGDVIAEWISTGAPELETLFQVQNVLLLVSLPSDISTAESPELALIETSPGKMTSARFVSRALRTDPRLQGQSFFYTAAAKDSGLLPGMNVNILMPLGPESAGVVVPGAAAVWWQGKAWVYVESRPNEFTRCEIATDFPVELSPNARQSLGDVGALPLRNSAGTYVRLRQLADVFETSGRYVNPAPRRTARANSDLQRERSRRQFAYC